MVLTIDRLSKQYKNKIAVDRFSAELNAGVYGLLGANGAGKTTLMRLICDIQTPTAGEVRYDGRAITELGEDWRDRLGYLPQSFGYYPDFTAESCMLYMAALKGLSKVEARERTSALLETVSLSEDKKRKIKTFSGGMRQRLGIAQAMLNDPDVLILDEPTAGLDPKERVRFRNLISTFSENKIVLLSTHIVSDVEYIANEILVMRDGQLIHRGGVAKLLGEIEGKVWRVSCGTDEVERYEAGFTVINVVFQPKIAELRIVADEKPSDNAISEEARLEDLYLYYFGKENGDGGNA